MTFCVRCSSQTWPARLDKQLRTKPERPVCKTWTLDVTVIPVNSLNDVDPTGRLFTVFYKHDTLGCEPSAPRGDLERKNDPPHLHPVPPRTRYCVTTVTPSRIYDVTFTVIFGGLGQRVGSAGVAGGRGEGRGGRQIPKGLPTGPTPRAGRYALFPIRTPSTMLRLHHYRITRVFQAPSSIFP